MIRCFTAIASDFKATNRKEFPSEKGVKVSNVECFNVKFRIDCVEDSIEMKIAKKSIGCGCNTNTTFQRADDTSIVVP